MYYFNIISGII